MTNNISFVHFVDFYNATYGYGKDQIEQYLLGNLEASRPTPQVHYEMAQWLETTDHIDKRILQAYRHCGKSWLISLYCAWRIYCNPNITILMLSAERSIAERNAPFIRDILVNNPLTEDLIDENPDNWKKTQFTVKRTAKSLNPTFMSLSATGNITGHHADLLIGDDVEVSKNIRTEEMREWMKSRIREMYAMVDQHLFIGTPHHKDSLYQYLVHDLDYKIIKFPVENTFREPLNTDMGHDEDWINDKRRTLTTGEFNSQFLLIPDSIEETVIDVDALKEHNTFKEDIEVRDSVLLHIDDEIVDEFFMDDEKIKQIVAYWDAASGMQGRDDSVLAVVAQTYSGKVYFVDCVMLPAVDRETGFEKQCLAVLKACQKHHVNTVHVEKNFSMTLATELKRFAKQQRVKVRVKEATRTSIQKKEIFMAQQIEPLCKIGRLYVHQRIWKTTPFENQLRDLGYAKHDDTTDALAGAIDALFPNNVNLSEYKDLSTSPNAHLTVHQINYKAL